ncbi:hypothetical protein FQN60_002767, partial [Etheostoma spectabile]
MDRRLALGVEVKEGGDAILLFAQSSSMGLLSSWASSAPSSSSPEPIRLFSRFPAEGNTVSILPCNGLRFPSTLCTPPRFLAFEHLRDSCSDIVVALHSSARAKMNKAVVVFMKDEQLVHQLIESGVYIRDSLVPSTRITVSGVPPFITNEVLEKELRRFGKFASGFKTVTLGCKDPKLQHVQSLRRQVFMFLDSATQTLEVSFRVRHGDGSYMVYASSGQMKCFECGGVGHKRFACPLRKRAPFAGEAAAPAAPSAADGGPGSADVEPGAVSEAVGVTVAGGEAEPCGVADVAGCETV